MSVLHKLMERKDLKNYLDLRIKQLNYSMRKVPDEVKKRDRHKVIERLKARRKELKRLRHELSQNNIKGKSKDMWQFLYDKGEVEYRTTIEDRRHPEPIIFKDIFDHYNEHTNTTDGGNSPSEPDSDGEHQSSEYPAAWGR